MSLSLVVMLWVGDHSSKTGEKRWHGALGVFLAAAGMFFGTMTNNPILAFLFMCMTGIGVSAPLGVWWSCPTTFLSGTAAAGAVGLINSFGQHRRLRRPIFDRIAKGSDGELRQRVG